MFYDSYDDCFCVFCLVVVGGLNGNLYCVLFGWNVYGWGRIVVVCVVYGSFVILYWKLNGFGWICGVLGNVDFCILVFFDECGVVWVCLDCVSDWWGGSECNKVGCIDR